MIGVTSGAALVALSCLLTYLVYSTTTTVLAWLACRVDCVNAAASRVRVWKLALLLPLPLSAVAILVPAPWLPEFRFHQTTNIERKITGVEGSDPMVAMPAASNGAYDLRPAAQSRRDGSLESQAPANQLRSDHANGPAWWSIVLSLAVFVLWPLGAVIGLVLLTRDVLTLHRVTRVCRPITEGPVYRQLLMLRGRMHIKEPVHLLESSHIQSPFAAGWRSPCILLPTDWIEQLTTECREAVLAHELAHISGRDAAWNLVIQIIRRVFWFQPLNFVACHRLRREMEFAADQHAARTIDDPADLARSLVQLAERLMSGSPKKTPVPSLVAGMSVHMSGLKQRVSAVLSFQRRVSEPLVGAKITGAACLACFVLLMVVPRFGLPPSTNHSGDSPHMLSAFKKMGLMTGLFAATMTSPNGDAFAQGDTVRTGEAAQSTDTAEGLPKGMKQFSGMLIGKMVNRDIERGSFTVKVDYVARVWENNKATKPRAVVGKPVTVNGVTGKWLDELLLVRPGETVEFEAQHRGGDELTFPGEWLKKVPAFDADQHPVPPEGFRGFSGMVTGKIIQKNPTSRELHLRIDSIEETFGKNRARAAKSVIGKDIVLAGFWAKMNKPFEKLEKGDRIRAGVLHRVPQSDHFTVIEMAEKIRAAESSSREASASERGFPAGMKGFRGILRGTLVSKDVEKGTLVFKAERATRTWNANRASDTSSCRGRELRVEGISGKWVDVLITMKPGDKIEVEAFHNSGEHLDFVAEWLKKVDE